MPNKNKIINLEAARRKQRGAAQEDARSETPPTYEQLVWIAELEDALEIMKKAGIQTIEQLEALIANLEALTSTDE